MLSNKKIMKMLSLRGYKHHFLRLTKCRPFSSLAKTSDSEYTATPQYPPILDLSYDKVVERKKQARDETIKKVKTVEEKQIKLNMPRFYGFKCYMMFEEDVPYNNLTLTQHVTRTHLIQSPELPEYYNKIETASVIMRIKEDIEDALLMELDGYQRMHDLKKEELDQVEVNNIISVAISKQVNRTVLRNLSGFYPHLINVQIDIDPRIESFWFAGGMNPPENIKRYRKGQEAQKDRINEPTDRAMNYVGSANLALRGDKPLPQIISASDAENPALEVPFYEYDPRTVKISTQHRHIANIPGYWPGDPNPFGILSYHRRGHILKRPYHDPQDNEEAIHRQGILASFGWLNAQANFLGFNTFNDLTYPLTAQTIVTDGQLWSFYVYQLNTLLNHSKNVHENPKRNICWATPTTKLYEEVQGDKLIGFNDDVLKNLIKLYANVPEIRAGVEMMPYVSKEERVIADYEDDEKRQWLEREYKYLVANRPRLKLPYEIYAWEKIYKIDNETRPIEARRRPFELKIKPWKRTLDDRKPGYIPRALRPDLPRHKGRNAKEFFP